MTHPYRPPPIETATDPIHSPADMGQRWRALMGELGFGLRLLWVGFVGPDRRMIKALSQVELRATADAGLADEVITGCRDVLADFPDGTTVALLLTRPAWGRCRDWTGSGRNCSPQPPASTTSSSSRSSGPTTSRWTRYSR